MSPPPTGRRGLESIERALSKRDLAVLESVSAFRLLTARQLEQLHFVDHETPLAAARATRRSLERLAGLRVLHRLDRRIGGVRAGSAGFIYAVGPIGDRLLAENRPRRRPTEPTARFADHTLAVADVAIALQQAHRAGRIELLGCQPEPHCWRQFTRGIGGLETLRPDLFVAIGLGEFEDRWFVEVDMATESTTAILRKCQQYVSHRASGHEQRQHGVYPKVLWIAPQLRRADQLRRAIATMANQPEDLFVVTTADEALTVLAGGDAAGGAA